MTSAYVRLSVHSTFHVSQPIREVSHLWNPRFLLPKICVVSLVPLSLCFSKARSKHFEEGNKTYVYVYVYTVCRTTRKEGKKREKKSNTQRERRRLLRARGNLRNQIKRQKTRDKGFCVSN